MHHDPDFAGEWVRLARQDLPGGSDAETVDHPAMVQPRLSRAARR